jgi:sugar transferase (PEP-CTERM/EpsH1 system associated)
MPAHQRGGNESREDLADRSGDSRPAILFVSMCVPNPPDKGEKIRSFYLLRRLAKSYRVHLVCFARNDSEVEAARELRAVCSSVYVEKLSAMGALLRGGLRLLAGGCVNAGYYYCARMKRYVDTLAHSVDFAATLVFAAVMMPYASSQGLALLDMQDVDSEKWFSYAKYRAPGMLYNLEARRLRKFETDCANAAACTVLTTRNEESLLRSFVPGVRTTYMENGVDFDYFDAQPRDLPVAFAGRRFIAFVGTMNYYPNIEGVSWFAREVFPELRRQDPGLEFLIIGNRPTKQALELGAIKGVSVTGGVADIRPFLAQARALVVPLRIARGIQNKVLEGLAMGRRVYVTEAVARTFGTGLPQGLAVCATENEFVARLSQESLQPPRCEAEIRRAACDRFSWGQNLETVVNELEIMIGAKPGKSSFVGEKRGRIHE